MLANDFAWKIQGQNFNLSSMTHTKKNPLFLCLITLQQISLVVATTCGEPNSSSLAQVDGKLSSGWNLAFEDGTGGPHLCVSAAFTNSAW